MQHALNKRLLLSLSLLAIGMFGFCFALVPLYNVFCKVTGLNGKIDLVTQVEEKLAVDKTRTLTVELFTTLNQTLAAEFSPRMTKVTLHPGEYVAVAYRVKNITDKPIVVQAIPSIAPGLAARHLKKIECFCFQHQPLHPLEEKELRMVFTVDPALAQEIQTLSLAYTLFDVTER